jgi:hypothetical protein
MAFTGEELYPSFISKPYNSCLPKEAKEEIHAFFLTLPELLKESLSLRVNLCNIYLIKEKIYRLISEIELFNKIASIFGENSIYCFALSQWSSGYWRVSYLCLNRAIWFRHYYGSMKSLEKFCQVNFFYEQEQRLLAEEGFIFSRCIMEKYFSGTLTMEELLVSHPEIFTTLDYDIFCSSRIAKQTIRISKELADIINRQLVSPL